MSTLLPSSSDGKNAKKKRSKRFLIPRSSSPNCVRGTTALHGTIQVHNKKEEGNWI